MSALFRALAIGAVIALAIAVRTVNRRWFAAVRRGQPRRHRALGVETLLADAVLVVMVVAVSLAVLAA